MSQIVLKSAPQVFQKTFKNQMSTQKERHIAVSDEIKLIILMLRIYQSGTKTYGNIMTISLRNSNFSKWTKIKGPITLLNSKILLYSLHFTV